MTVKELIEKLQQYPPDMLIYVDDSEYGPEETDAVRVEKATIWEGPKSYKVDVLVIG